MPCNHFIMTNRNSNAVPCEPGRGKIELTANCSCLGNGEERREKERRKEGDEERGGGRSRELAEGEGERRAGFGAAEFLASAPGLSGLGRFHKGALVSAASS